MENIRNIKLNVRLWKYYSWDDCFVKFYLFLINIDNIMSIFLLFIYNKDRWSFVLLLLLLLLFYCTRVSLLDIVYFSISIAYLMFSMFYTDNGYYLYISYYMLLVLFLFLFYSCLSVSVLTLSFCLLNIHIYICLESQLNNTSSIK